jgi:hypothetical protein
MYPPLAMPMSEWLEKTLVRLWNRKRSRSEKPNRREFDLGAEVRDGEAMKSRVGVPEERRAESIAILGKTGSGKSFLIRHLLKQDIGAGRGFCLFDLHGDLSDFVVATIADRERTLKRDLSDRLIVIDPADPEASVGVNPLEPLSADDRFVQIAEFAEILKERWHLDSLGARTDELLRNVLHVIADNGLTLVELAPLLRDAAFRSRCLARVSNADVKEYFELRYDRVSEAMRAVLAEPILNKTSAFTSDPRFRHIVGQTQSSFLLVDALDEGKWIVLNLHRGKLGEQSTTLGSLFFAQVKHALFARRSRNLVTLYADEIQNFVTFGGGIEAILSEARKFATPITSANQFLSQFPPDMRAAILAVGTLICFQLSGPDAQQLATAFDGGKALAERLKNLPRRHFVAKTVHERIREGIVPRIDEPTTRPTDLYLRSRARWARNRAEVEREIRSRHAGMSNRNREVLDDWD